MQRWCSCEGSDNTERTVFRHEPSNFSLAQKFSFHPDFQVELREEGTLHLSLEVKYIYKEFLFTRGRLLVCR